MLNNDKYVKSTQSHNSWWQGQDLHPGLLFPVLIPFGIQYYYPVYTVCMSECVHSCICIYVSCVCVVLVYVWEIIRNTNVFLLYNMVHFMKDTWLKWCNKRREWPTLPGVAREALTHECGIVKSEGCSRKRKKNDDVIWYRQLF